MILVAYPTDINEPRKGLLTVSEKEIERWSAVNFVYNIFLKNNKLFPCSERNKNFLKTVEVEYFVRTNRTSSATVEM